MGHDFQGTHLHSDTLGVAEVNRRREQFEAAWENLASPDAVVELDEFLPDHDSPFRVPVLRVLLPLDLDARWRRGHPVLIEQYRERFPELGEMADIPVSVVVAEYLARNQYGDRPRVEDYILRLPHAVPELKKAREAQTVPVDDGTGTVTLSKNASEFLMTLSAPPAPTAAAPSGDRGGSGLSGMPTDAGFEAGINLAPPDQGYKLGEKLGAGAFGEVRKAEAPGGVDVALKIIFRPLSHAAAQQELRSLDLIKKLRHPYLLQTHAYWSLLDRLMIVMEMADGSLKDRKVQCIAEGHSGIPVEELLEYMTESAEAIDYLHAQGIQHRDIKPANLLLIGRHIKLADFGLAQLQPKTPVEGEGDRSGTPGFMAPEVWQGNACPASDQYALAVSYVELRLGRLPFPGRSMVEQMTAHMTCDPDLTGLEEAEAAIVARALAKRPENRFASCTEFAAALAEVFAPPPPPPEPTPLWKKIAVVAIPLLAIVGAVAFAIFQPEPEPVPLPPWLPAQGQAEDTATVTKIGDRDFYNQIILQRGDQVVPFRLIPPVAGSSDQPFYMMMNMVSNGLFESGWNDPEYQAALKKFTERDPWLSKNEWRRGGEIDEADTGVSDPNLPVFRVTVTEAHCLAEWLGGLLPTREQWWRAAGKFGPGDRPGPAIPDCERGIAIDRFTLGPAPVGSSGCDVSPFGIRDMAGNGREWTRTTTDLLKDPLVPVSEPRADIAVFLLSQSYLTRRNPKPYFFDNEVESATYDETQPDIGFRVVLIP